MTTALLFAGGLVVIVAAAEAFTNAVEWAGFRLNLGSGPTGSLLAALGTALPETVVPIVALIRGAADADRVAIGAVLGGPFLLLTLGMGATGLAVMLRRSRPILEFDATQARRDLLTFLTGSALLALALPLPRAARVAVGGGLLALYATHVVRTLGGGGDAGEEEPEPLHLWRWSRGRPHGAAILVQLAVAMAGLIGGADLFVAGLASAASSLGISSLVLAVLLVPVATELPETLNSVLWVRSHDDPLAIGNVAGATAFQACIPGFVGVAFTSWSIGAAGYLVGAVTLSAGVASLVMLRGGGSRGGRLALLALLWVAYAAVALLLGGRLAEPGS